MQVLSRFSPKIRPGFRYLKSDHPNGFHEDAVWRCWSAMTGRTHVIHGGLAQVLTRYPNRFRLKLLAAPSIGRAQP